MLDDDRIIMINNYINEKIEIYDSYEENIFELLKLKIIFLNISIDDLDNLLVEVIKSNKKLYELLGVTFNNELFKDDDIFIEKLRNTFFSITSNNKVLKNDDYELSSINQYLKEISSISLLSSDKEDLLLKRSSKGDQKARDMLIESNLRLVVSIATRYKYCGIDLSDLIQEGSLGLMAALDKYDYKKNVKFSTYATWWINQKIKYYIIEQSSIITFSYHTFSEISKIKSVYYRLYSELGRKPTIDEISSILNIKKERIIELFGYEYRMLSIYDKVGESEDIELVDFIKNPGVNVEENFEEEEFNYLIRSIFIENNILSDTEKDVLRRRFGINGNVESNIDIGKKFNITGEAVRQMILRSIKKVLKKYKDIILNMFEGDEQIARTIDSVYTGEFKLKMKIRPKSCN